MNPNQSKRISEINKLTASPHSNVQMWCQFIRKMIKSIKSNYRPISLEPILGKILKKLIYDLLYSHLVSSDILDPNQSGFHPCDTAINQLLFIALAIFKSFYFYPLIDV